MLPAVIIHKLVHIRHFNGPAKLILGQIAQRVHQWVSDRWCGLQLFGWGRQSQHGLFFNTQLLPGLRNFLLPLLCKRFSLLGLFLNRLLLSFSLRLVELPHHVDFLKRGHCRAKQGGNGGIMGHCAGHTLKSISWYSCLRQCDVSAHLPCSGLDTFGNHLAKY